MNNMLSKLSLYDQVGYLLVGSIALLVAYADTVILGMPFPAFTAANLVIWFIVAYFFGHVTQAIANLIIREKKDTFSEKEQEILNIGREYLGVTKATDSDTWQLCYMLASAKDVTGQVQTFNAFYSLYRGWAVVFGVETFLMTGYTIMSFSITKLVMTLCSLALSLLFYRRQKRFSEYFRSKVLQTVLLLRRLEQTKEVQ